MSVLSAEGVAVELDGQALLHDVDLTVGSDEMLALVGPNGAGKSTLVRALVGLTRLSAGEVKVAGRPLSSWSARALAMEMSYVGQDHPPVDLTVEELVLMGRYAHRARFAGLTVDDRQAARSALATAGLDGRRARTVASLSGGERQLAHISRALAQDAPLLLLDEPTAALDLKHQLTVLSLLRELALAGRSVIVVLHDLNQAARFCDRIAVLDHGTVRAVGAPAEVLTPDRIAEVYGVEAVVRRDPDLGTLQIVPLHLFPTHSGSTHYP